MMDGLPPPLCSHQGTHNEERDERLVTRRLHDSSTTRQGDNIPLKWEWRIGRGKVVFNAGERDRQREKKMKLSPDVRVSRIRNVLSCSLSLPGFGGWREAVGQAVWAVRYLKPESTVPPCVSFIGEHRKISKSRG